MWGHVGGQCGCSGPKSLDADVYIIHDDFLEEEISDEKDICNRVSQGKLGHRDRDALFLTHKHQRKIPVVKEELG